MRSRRIGNSNMVALPSELEKAGDRPGVEILVQGMPDGQVRIARADLAQESTREVAHRPAERHRRALERRADHDRQR
jgi:hypothetical protein